MKKVIMALLILLVLLPFGSASAEGGSINVAVDLQGSGWPSRVTTLRIGLLGEEGTIIEGLSHEENGKAVINVPLSSGTYSIVVLGENTLANVRENVVIGENETVYMGMLLGGDSNEDGIINILDFSAMVPAFLQSEGDPGYSRNVDYDKNGIVNILDFSILVTNYGKMSPIILP